MSIFESICNLGKTTTTKNQSNAIVSKSFFKDTLFGENKTTDNGRIEVITWGQGNVDYGCIYRD